MDVESFCDQFTKIWMQYRDSMLAKRFTWTERYDLELQQMLEHGEITKEEFGVKWLELWGYANTLPLINMIDVIHSSCDAFNYVPESEWEIDENQLRLEVANAIAVYKSTNNKQE